MPSSCARPAKHPTSHLAQRPPIPLHSLQLSYASCADFVVRLRTRSSPSSSFATLPESAQAAAHQNIRFTTTWEHSSSATRGFPLAIHYRAPKSSGWLLKKRSPSVTRTNKSLPEQFAHPSTTAIPICPENLLSLPSLQIPNRSRAQLETGVVPGGSQASQLHQQSRTQPSEKEILPQAHRRCKNPQRFKSRTPIYITALERLHKAAKLHRTSPTLSGKVYILVGHG